MKIDLGSGGCRQEGFLGIDRYPLEGVDVVADLNETFPLANDSVDLLFASHSLEHLKDLISVVREIYRVCKHGAQVCIVAPYFEQKLNLANPYHICAFNEHTPRFWTDFPYVPVDVAEYFHPHASGWGLSQSDHSNPGVDIRLVGMEFFYFPEYRYLPVEQKRKLRRERIDVCDQIMYHLIVWKGDFRSPEISFEKHVSNFIPFVPRYILERRETEKKEFFKKYDQISDNIQDIAIDGDGMKIDFTWLFSKIESLYGQLKNVNADLAKAQTIQESLVEKNIELKNENEKLRLKDESVDVLKAQMLPLRADIEAANGLLNWYKSKEKSWNNEMARLREELSVVQKGGANWDMAKRTVENLFTQLGEGRSSRKFRWKSLLNRNDNQWNSVSSPFLILKDYTDRHFPRPFRAKLVLGCDLRAIPYREYIVPFAVESLSTVSLAINPLLPVSHGTVGVEVVSNFYQVLSQTTLPVSEIRQDLPSVFHFVTPITNLGSKWRLRVFVKNVDVPISIYEIEKCLNFRAKAEFLPFVLLS